MKIDGALISGLAEAAEDAKRLEAAEYDGAYTFEGNRDPFYPLLLAALYRLAGADPAVARAFQLLLGCVTVGLLVILGKRIFGPTEGILTGVIGAAYWISIYFEGELLIASVLPLLATLVLLVLLWADRTGGGASALIAGALLGLFAAARPNVLLFLPVAAVWLALRRRKSSMVFLL